MVLTNLEVSFKLITFFMNYVLITTFVTLQCKYWQHTYTFEENISAFVLLLLFDCNLNNINHFMLHLNITGTFMKTLVSMTNAKNVLEVGLFTGCSALSMAEALPADGKLVACEILPYCAEMARRLMDKSSHGKKVTIQLGKKNEE